MGSTAAEFRDASTTTVTLSNKCEITIRRLGMPDVADCGPNAWAIFRAFTRYLSPDDDAVGADQESARMKVEKWEKAMQSLDDEFGDVLIARAAISPRVTLEGNGDDETIPIWTIPELDKQRIQQEIVSLASGFDALHAEEVAARIARFRGDTPEPNPEEAGDHDTGGDVATNGAPSGDASELAARG